ncbi:MAG: hypothetical protein COX29_01890 [Candidatus Moranbacteria bacterium CG23_combo_of_CG06-09_8_20_14_all_35_22]|nr:MAG: hypothetical protein COX29_01890 [Candidatus Moranbacteria bacterium CG23_combo_of_CG06-09_8_20_14_all_35_22]
MGEGGNIRFLGINGSDALHYLKAEELCLYPRSIRAALELGPRNLDQLERFHKVCVGLVEEAWGKKEEWYADTTPSFSDFHGRKAMGYSSNSGNTSSYLIEVGLRYLFVVGIDHEDDDLWRIRELKELGFAYIVSEEDSEVLLAKAIEILDRETPAFISDLLEKAFSEAGVKNFA